MKNDKQITLKNLRFVEREVDIFGKQMKVIYDGSHYVGTEVITNKKKKFLCKQETDNSSLEKKEYFDNLFYRAISEEFRFKKMSDCNKSDELKKWLQDNMLEAYPDIKDIENYISSNVCRKVHNYYLREKRLKNKAYMNKWNYFVTITYDDKKHSEESFKQLLKRCLSNLAYRRGYKYMGVFERSPVEKRLHFHAIMYIPENEMVGKLKQRTDYSTKQKRIQTTIYNTFFEKRFGRTDFEKIESFSQTIKTALDYMVKYLFKTDEQIFYSRGIKGELKLFVHNEDIASEYLKFVTRYVLFDDCIEDNIYKPYNYKIKKVKQLSFIDMPERKFKRLNKNSNVYKILNSVPYNPYNDFMKKMLIT